MSKDSPDFIEYVKNKFRKIRKSNPEEKGFGVFLGVMVSADSVCSFGRLIFSHDESAPKRLY
jgi:hypothetical protein